MRGGERTRRYRVTVLTVFINGTLYETSGPYCVLSGPMAR